MRIEEGRLIPAPPEAVWDYVQDYARRGEWDSSVIRVEKVSEGPLGVGGRIRLVCPAVWPLRFSWLGEYVSFQRPERSAVKQVETTFLGPFSSMAGTWVYEPRDGGTWFSMISHYTVKYGPLGQLADWLVLRWITRLVLRRSLARLAARMVEKGGAP